MKTNNKKVCDFYNQHPNIDFEEMNIIMVEMLTSCLSINEPSLDSKFALNIIQEMKQMNKNIDKMNSDSINNFALKFIEFKKEYITDIKLILNGNNNYIQPMMIEYNQILQDRVSILLNEFKISSEHKQSLKEIDNELKFISESNKNTNEKINEVLKKFENSSAKGHISENITYNLLRTMYAESQIVYSGNVKESGDIFIIRNEQPKILIENKDYKAKVDQLEVDKFIKDLKTQNCSGIFLSQRSGIANKNQYEINFYGNNIGIYISNVEYDTDRIQIGINMIDDIKKIMKDSETDETDDEITMDKNVFELINKDFGTFINQKLKHIKSIKEVSTKLINEVNEMNLPTLNTLLTSYYGSNISSQFICKTCGFVGKNAGSLASHNKKHTELN